MQFAAVTYCYETHISIHAIRAMNYLAACKIYSRTFQCCIIVFKNTKRRTASIKLYGYYTTHQKTTNHKITWRINVTLCNVCCMLLLSANFCKITLIAAFARFYVFGQIIQCCDGFYHFCVRRMASDEGSRYIMIAFCRIMRIKQVGFINSGTSATSFTAILQLGMFLSFVVFYYNS